VFKVGGKIFALTSLEKWELGSPGINLKCDPDRAQELRAEYESINSGFHMNKKLEYRSYQSRSFRCIRKELIDHSYELVFSSLTKKIQEEVSKL
jgi:predicted DNA-binding protein (MmcQ/YjbR family)